MSSRSFARRARLPREASHRLRRWLGTLALLLALLLLAPFVLAFAVLKLPVALLQAPVLSLSGERVRIALPSGKISAGRAELWVRDTASREWLPWLPIEWTVSLRWRDRSAALAPGIVLSSNVGQLGVDRSGVELSNLQLDLPPGLLLAGINHPLAGAPWRGDVELLSQRFFCRWSDLQMAVPTCDGEATLKWLAMGSAILPQQQFGDYLVRIASQSGSKGRDGRLRADFSTLAGSVLFNGFAEAKGGVVRHQLSIRGEPALIEGLTSVAGPPARKSADPGEYLMESRP